MRSFEYRAGLSTNSGASALRHSQIEDRIMISAGEFVVFLFLVAIVTCVFVLRGFACSGEDADKRR